MSEARKTRSSRPFVALALASVVALFQGGAPAVAGDDHDFRVGREVLAAAGDAVPHAQARLVRQSIFDAGVGRAAEQ